MQFREKGRKVLCLRSIYDKEKKRSFTKTIASQDIQLDVITDETESRLREDEKINFNAWLIERTKKRAIELAKHNIELACTRLDEITNAIKSGLTLISEQEGQEILKAIDRLKSGLREAGIRKRRKKT